MPLENVDKIRVSGKEEGAFSYHPSKRYRDFYVRRKTDKRKKVMESDDTSLLINE